MGAFVAAGVVVSNSVAYAVAWASEGRGGAMVTGERESLDELERVFDSAEREAPGQSGRGAYGLYY